MSSPDANAGMLDELTQCAFRMGQAFAAEAERAEDLGRKLELFQAFDRCFFSVRMGISLQLRLRRDAAMPVAPAARDERPAVAEAAERDERESDDHLPQEREREREREVERASLPALVRALRGVADGAAALPGAECEDLPRLRGLLAQFADEPAPRRSSRGIPRTPGGLRVRLAGSAAAPPLGPEALRAGLRGPPRPPRATGPPTR